MLQIFRIRSWWPCGSSHSTYCLRSYLTFQSCILGIRRALISPFLASGEMAKTWNSGSSRILTLTETMACLEPVPKPLPSYPLDGQSSGAVALLAWTLDGCYPCLSTQLMRPRSSSELKRGTTVFRACRHTPLDCKPLHSRSALILSVTWASISAQFKLSVSSLCVLDPMRKSCSSFNV